jgi:predicted transglutaminase-like protease
MAKRYQRGNQNPYIKEQTTQWPKEKVHKDKQRSIVENKRSSNTKPTKTAGKLRSSALNEVITSISVKHQTLLYGH